MNNLEWYKEELIKDIAEDGFCVISKEYMHFECPLSCNREDCVRDSLDWLLKKHVSHDKPSVGEHPDPAHMELAKHSPFKYLKEAHERKILDAKPVESIGCYKIEKMNEGTAFFQKPDSDTWVAKEYDSGTRLMSPNKFLQITFGVKKVLVNGPATIIFWEDGSKTVSVCDKDDKFDIEKGIGMCFMKKALGGSYTNVIDTLSRVADADNGYLSNDYISKIDNYLQSDISIMNWLFYVSNMIKAKNAASDTSVNDESSKAKVENSDDTSTEK